jgi:signal transduction histidine kinase
MSDELIFAEEDDAFEQQPHAATNGTWKILIVDDQEDVHNVTRMVLNDLAFEGRQISFISAYSGVEAKKMLKSIPEIAVVLLDVVMEEPLAGLDVARYVREEIGNQLIRIILRTGQPGQAPERDVVTDLDINDYRSKTELTSERLVISVITAIRSYRDLKTIDESRLGLHHLAMSVAHQIRNRTTTIAGFANIVKRNSDLPEEVVPYISTILEESARLEAMVKDVTQYACLKRTEVGPHSIRDLLEEAMDRVDGREIFKGGVTWEVFCPDQTVLVDPELFVLAFESLMQNSVDFSLGKPVVRLKVKPDRLACSIEVSDNGVGIAEKDLPHIFDPFFTHKPKGAGMGLALVRKIAMEHQWDLAVESKEGIGTTVRIIIPRRDLTGMATEAGRI